MSRCNSYESWSPDKGCTMNITRRITSISTTSKFLNTISTRPAPKFITSTSTKPSSKYTSTSTRSTSKYTTSISTSTTTKETTTTILTTTVQPPTLVSKNGKSSWIFYKANFLY